MRQGWEIEEFEKCLEKVTYTNKIQRKDFKEDGIYPIVSQEKDFINGYWDNEEDLFRVGKPVVLFGDHTQVLKFIDFDFVLGADGVKIVKPTDKIDSKYFYYFLQNVDIGGLGYARHYRLLKEINVTYPKSLTEQQRIVAILDEAFAAIDQAKANTERNLKNAKELFDSYLEEVFDKGAAGWEKRTLGEVASFSQGIQIGLEHHNTEPKEGYVRFIRIVDYTQNTDDIRYVPDPGHKYFVNEDDIIMVRYGTPGLIGRGKAGVIANNLFKITIQRDDILNDFLSLCLSQKRIRNYLSAQGSSTMPALNFGQLKTVMVNFPSLSAQHTIVRQLDALRAETQRLEALYQKKLTDLDELKKSILQKAFAGELTTA